MSDIQRVQKRPGMYIGDTDDRTGLHNMVCELVRNALDEGLEGFADHIAVDLRSDGACTVRDNGRGIPVAVHADERVPAAEFIMTRLTAGSNMGQQSTVRWRGGVGACVVNAVSEWLDLRIWREEKEYFLRFLDGEPQGSLRVVGDANGKRGTEISFLPSATIFSNRDFDAAIIERQLVEMALLVPDTRIVLTDRR